MSYHISTSADFVRHSRWDPEFYGKNYADLRTALLSHGARPLGDLVQRAVRGVSPNYDSKGGIRVINSVNVRELQISDERIARVAALSLQLYPTAAVKRYDVVITSTGIGTLGRSFCNLSDEVFFADGHITVISLNSPDLAPFVCSFLQSPIGRAQMIQRRRGSSRQVEIYPDDILQILIPPPGKHSAEIAARWLSAVEEMSVASRLYPEAEASLLDELGWEELLALPKRNYGTSNFRSLENAGRFDAEFFDDLSIRLEERLRQSGSLRFGDCVSAYIKGMQPQSYDLEGKIAVVKTKDVTRSGLNLMTCDRTNAEGLELNENLLAKDMLVLNMTGVGTLGRASVVPEVVGRAISAVDVAAWRVDERIISSRYLSLFLNSPAGSRQTLRFQSGSSGQLHIYPAQVNNLQVFVKRTKNGTVDGAWHDDLVEKVAASEAGRLRAFNTLRSIQEYWMKILNIRPSIMRE